MRAKEKLMEAEVYIERLQRENEQLREINEQLRESRDSWIDRTFKAQARAESVLQDRQNTLDRMRGR